MSAFTEVSNKRQSERIERSDPKMIPSIVAEQVESAPTGRNADTEGMIQNGNFQGSV